MSWEALKGGMDLRRDVDFAAKGLTRSALAHGARRRRAGLDGRPEVFSIRWPWTELRSRALYLRRHAWLDILGASWVFLTRRIRRRSSSAVHTGNVFSYPETKNHGASGRRVAEP